MTLVYLHVYNTHYNCNKIYNWGRIGQIKCFYLYSDSVGLSLTASGMDLDIMEASS